MDTTNNQTTQAIPLNQDSSPEAVTELLFKLKVKDVMTTDVVTVTPTQTLREAQQVMKERHITGVPVVVGKNLAGLVSMDNIVSAFDTGTIDETCDKKMTRNTIVLQDNMPLSFAVSYFNKFKFGRFPVLNGANELVGIVTTSDVISALLVAMNKEVERLEHEAMQAQAALENGVQSGDAVSSGSKERSSLLKKVQDLKKMPNRVIEFKTEPFNFETAGQASTEVKKILRGMNVDPALTRRIGIASYELEINQVVHSDGGIMRYYITPEKLTIEAVDTGPGIKDVEKALTEGFSTASDRVRALGFGAGMGLPNTRRVSDGFQIKSEVGKGTTVHSWFFFGPQDKPQER